jgi:hypothetical protein
MPEGYKKEQFWQLYKNLPPELKEALFAKETGRYLHTVCQRAGILEKLDEVSEYVGQVFLGILPPENFQRTIKDGLGIDLETAQQLTKEIGKLIFEPVAPILEKIYHPEEIQPERPSIYKTTEPEQGVKKETKKDLYRETIE